MLLIKIETKSDEPMSAYGLKDESHGTVHFNGKSLTFTTIQISALTFFSGTVT